jgi:glycerol uptake facilitator-like aquaporin
LASTEAADATRGSPKSRPVHLRHVAYELLLTFLLLFVVVTLVRWVIGPSLISSAIPGIHLQLLVVGAVVGLTLTLLILSSLGKESGGHVNPAITVAMWRFGVFPRKFVLPYIAAQLLGSILGVLAARLVWGAQVAQRPVAYAVLQPESGWSTWGLLLAEATTVAVIVLVVGLLLADARLANYVPWAVGGLVGLVIVVLGTVTGGSANPARQFGPAVLSGQTRWLWVYLGAPILGALLAAEVRRVIQPRKRVSTHSLCGPDRLLSESDSEPNPSS